MGVPPSEAGRLSLWEYQAMLWHWNEAHKPEGEGAAESALDPARVRRDLAALAAQNGVSAQGQ